jgi:MFS family permease
MDYVFQNAPRTARALELKEELIVNLTDRYHDLIQQGESEDAAYSIVIAGIGDAEELIHGLREYEMFDPVSVQMQRQRSAVLTALAVGLFVASIVFPIIFQTIFYWLPFYEIGFVLMVLCWAAGIALLVYNNMSKPKYVKLEETIVEDFKEWKGKKAKKKSFVELLHGLVWLVTVPLFLCLGVFFNAWHPGWLIFVMAPLVNVIINLVCAYNEEEK